MKKSLYFTTLSLVLFTSQSVIAEISLEEMLGDVNKTRTQMEIESAPRMHKGLHGFARWGDIDEVIGAIEDGKASINSRTESGASLLHISSLHGHDALAKALINKDANVHARDYNDRTPLFDAISSNSPKTVLTLLEADAEVNIVDSSTITPLMHACSGTKTMFDEFTSLTEEMEKIIKLLISYGANVNEIDSDGNTALHYLATIMNNSRVATRILISNEAQINARNNAGLTPLSIAKINNNKEVMNVLIANGGKE